MSTKEIFVAVAEECGWKNVRFDYADGCTTFKSWLGEKDGYVNGPPFYTDDFTACKELCDAANERGLHILMSRAPNMLWQVSFIGSNKPLPQYHAEHRDIETAICIAFLKMVGKWKEAE